MENDADSLRWKLRQERRVLQIARSGFMLGAMGFAAGIYFFSAKYHQNTVVLGFGVGAAVGGIALEQVMVAVYRIVVFRAWKRDATRRLGRVLHDKAGEKLS